MRLDRQWVVAAAVISIAGCMDGSRVLSPPGAQPRPLPHSVRSEMAPDGYETPAYASSSELPPEYSLAEIRTRSAEAHWEGATARGYASMEYFGNRGRQDLNLTVLHDYTTVGTTQGTGTGSAFLPQWLLLGTPLSLTVPNDCGQVVDLHVHYTASIYVLLNYSLTEISRATDLTDASSHQPSCDPCTGTATPVRDASYDPYSDGSADTNCGTSGSASGGTQYYPGDYTGGETVDWTTGIGDGGSSLCGPLAMVEYACIELEEGGKWVLWGCGYVTTC